MTSQGPHIYALYKYQKGLPERTVAALYASGFIAAAVSASFVGQLADRHGRRAACLVYCVSYSVCCLSMVSDNMTVLFAGRMAGGLSTTLLYSVFETWMITEYHQRDLEAAGLTLSNILSTMTTISSMVAIFCGIFGDALVAVTQSRVSPFLASVASLVAAFVFIARYWVRSESCSSKEKSPLTQLLERESWRSGKWFAWSGTFIDLWPKISLGRRVKGILRNIAERLTLLLRQTSDLPWSGILLL